MLDPRCASKGYAKTALKALKPSDYTDKIADVEMAWVDKDGNIYYGDSIPPEYAEQPKQVLNDQGVTVDHLAGKKTEEEILAERKAAELEEQIELQQRADQALLATYVNVDEIIMHRDRRVELYQAQARVTELYLRNAQRRLNSLERDAKRYKPYSSDPNAPVRPEQGLLQLRALLGVYANLRPVTIYPELASASPLKAELLEGVDVRRHPAVRAERARPHPASHGVLAVGRAGGETALDVRGG